MEVLHFWTISLALALCCTAVSTRSRYGNLLCVGQGENNVFEFSEEPSSRFPDDRGGGVGRQVALNGGYVESTLQKRSALGLFGLATKRPHKSVADLIHPPPLDAFMSVRGRKRSSSGYGKSWEGPLPGYALLSYPPPSFTR